MIRILLLLMLAIVNQPETPAQADLYEIDPGHTFVHFTVNRFDMVDVVSTFTDVSGTIHFDAENIEATKANILIKTESLESGYEKRDQAVKGPAFLNVAEFPEIKYENKRIEKMGDQNIAHGVLTIHGTSNEVSFPVTIKGPEKDPTGLTAIALKGELKINRQNFGITFDRKLPSGKSLIGDTVKIEINALAIKQE